MTIINAVRAKLTAAFAAIRARCPNVRPMALGLGLSVILLGALVGRSQAQVGQRADSAATRIAAEVAALRDKLSAPPAAPQVGYDGQAVAWAKARLDFSKK